MVANVACSRFHVPPSVAELLTGVHQQSLVHLYRLQSATAQTVGALHLVLHDLNFRRRYFWRYVISNRTRFPAWHVEYFRSALISSSLLQMQVLAQQTARKIAAVNR